MSEWYDSQKKPNGNFRELLQQRIEEVNPRRKLTGEEVKRINKLESIAEKLKRGENVQNRQLQTWLSEEEYTDCGGIVTAVKYSLVEFLVPNVMLRKPQVP